MGSCWRGKGWGDVGGGAEGGGRGEMGYEYSVRPWLNTL